MLFSTIFMFKCFSTEQVSQIHGPRTDNTHISSIALVLYGTIDYQAQMPFTATNKNDMVVAYALGLICGQV